jgi:putative transposase
MRQPDRAQPAQAQSLVIPVGREVLIEDVRQRQALHSIMDPENCTVSPGVFVPTMTSKKVYSSTLKAQVVQEILREDKTLTQIASEHGIHPKVVREWKAIALRELPTLFERQTSVAALKADHERQLEDLYAEIGRLTTQLTWVKKKSGI